MTIDNASRFKTLEAEHGVSFAEATRLWLKVGLLGFGGPAGQIALMHRLIVDEKRWLGEARFLHALNYCMLLPGPEAQQLATYIGWLLHGLRGGLAAGLLFFLPGALVMLTLSILYTAYADLTAVNAIFYGVKAAVLAIVVEAIVRIGRRALKTPLMLAVAAGGFVALFFFALPFPLIVAGAALIGWIASRTMPSHFLASASGGSISTSPEGEAVIDRALNQGKLAHTRASITRTVQTTLLWLLIWFVPVLVTRLSLGSDNTFTAIGTFFSQMAIVTFGGAYAVLAYVGQEAVQTYHWLTTAEMMDGLALAETTPGPLILVLQHVGFIAASRAGTELTPYLAGTLGAVLTLWVTFTPSFLWIFAGAPYAEKLRSNKAVSAALATITAAVVGVILNLALWFALHVVFGKLGERWIGPLRLYEPDFTTLDLWSLALSAAAMIALLRFKVGMLYVLAAAAVLGLLVKLAF